ncbi:MAG: amidohydrolase family protein, partial [Pseudomonadales bacterium]
ACAIVHSDSAFDIQRLNQEAAKALAAGQRMGLDMGIETAISWITLNAARALGLEDEIGSIEVGKVADIVVWDGNPFSVYTRTKLVLIDGVVRFDRAKGIVPVTDFELGY